MLTTFLKYFLIVSVTTTLTLVFVETEEGKGLLAKVGLTGEVPAAPVKVAAKQQKPQKIDPVVERILSKPAPDLTPPPAPPKERAVAERAPVVKPKSETFVSYESPVYRSSPQPGKS